MNAERLGKTKRKKKLVSEFLGKELKGAENQLLLLVLPSRGAPLKYVYLPWFRLEQRRIRVPISERYYMVYVCVK